MHDHGSHGGHSTKEEQIALLSYMVSHNESHTEEIHEIAHGVSGQAAVLLHDATALYQEGNKKLAEALELIKEA